MYLYYNFIGDTLILKLAAAIVCSNVPAAAVDDVYPVSGHQYGLLAVVIDYRKPKVCCNYPGVLEATCILFP